MGTQRPGGAHTWPSALAHSCLQDNAGVNVQWCKQGCNTACIVAITVPVVVGSILICTGIWWCHRRRRMRVAMAQTTYVQGPQPMGLYAGGGGIMLNGAVMQPMPIYAQQGMAGPGVWPQGVVTGQPYNAAPGEKGAATTMYAPVYTSA